MKKWDVELSCGIGFTVTGVEADTKENAIKKAKHLVDSSVSIMAGPGIEEGSLTFEQCSFAKQVR